MHYLLPKIFNPRTKALLHCIQLLGVLAVLTLSLSKVIIDRGIKSRADTMAMAMGAKSIIFIAYQLLTEHVPSLLRYSSHKANTIINCTEIVFYAAVVYLVAQANNVNECIPTICQLNWGIVAIAVSLSDGFEEIKR
ncbi:hypothetical protein BX600DRAFT_434835 [Xylariales sp. PMI_506]|nr:hypothetical protein BX600DRAFT_434835 [Xylariales sp. PMI_506]